MPITFLTNEDKTIIDQNIAQLSEEIAERGKPRVFIDGMIPTTKDDVLAELTYEHGPERWHAYITIKCQGTSSMAYPKKNFTVKLYSDEARTVKLKKKMFGWPVASHKFVLKANWIDHTHARNIVTARLWSEIVASRTDYDSLPDELRNSPNNGAIDGVPIVVYTNGNYQGIYTWNIGKDDWLWGMDEDNPNHVLLCAETNTDGVFRATPCNFRSLWSGINEQDWSVEVGANSTAVKDSLNALIACVKDTDDATFKSTIGNYLDVQSAIDYYLLTCADCGIDSLGKNMLMGTYDLRKWYCGKYDLDSTWLLWWTGTTFVSAATDCPTGYQEKFSLLWSRLRNVFWRDLKERGIELRKTILSYANIMSHFECFCAEIGNEAYADDLVVYSSIPSAGTNNIWQLRNAVRDRLVYFDNWLDAIQDGVSCEGITINQSELSVEVGETLTLIATVTPGNTSDNVIWSSSNDAVVRCNAANGYVTGVKDGIATISVICGKHIATCKVTVGVGEVAPLYKLSEAKTFTGVSGEMVRTGVDVVSTDQDFTIAMDFTPDGSEANSCILNGYTYADNFAKIIGVDVARNSSNNPDYWYVNIMNGTSGVASRCATTIPIGNAERSAIVIRHAAGSGKYQISSAYGDSEVEEKELMSAWHGASGVKCPIYIGAGGNGKDTFFVGTVHRCAIYSYTFTDDEVVAFIDDMN